MGHRREHLRFHTGEKPQVSKVWHGVCWPWCTNKSCKDTQKRPNIFYMKKIMRNPELQSHQAIHSDIRPHNCSMSDATFKRRQELRLHILKHTGEKPLICTKCEKKTFYLLVNWNHTLRHITRSGLSRAHSVTWPLCIFKDSTATKQFNEKEHMLYTGKI